MEHLEFKAQILFLESASKYFRFPIKIKKIRLSFWLLDSTSSTPSETEFEEYIFINRYYDVNIMIIYMEFLNNKISEGQSFYIGIYPEIVAKGKILKIYE